MLKVVLPHAFNFGVPVARIVDLHSRGVDRDWMQKRAAVLTKEIAAVRPEKGHTFIHAISMGSMEAYGSNRNGDGFNEKSAVWHAFDPKPDGPKSITLDGGLQQFHRTFVKYAKVYKDHCFVDGTPVVMADRVRKPIESVQCGDLVATRDGSRRVVRVMRRRYSGVGVKTTLSGVPTPLVSTKEHPFFVLRRDQIHCRHKYNRLAENASHAEHCREYCETPGGPVELPAVALKKGDYLVFPRPRLGSVEVESAFARLIGWVAAEGYLGVRGAIQFTFAEHNVDDIAAVQTQFENLGVHCSLTRRGDGLMSVTACNAKLHARLSKYVAGVLSEKRLLPAVFELNESAVRQLLEAYIDGDGCVQQTGAHRGDLRIRSSSPCMRACLSDLIRALGVPARCNDDFDGGEMVSPTNGLTYESRPSGVVCVGRSFAGELATGRKAAAVVEPAKQQTRDLLDDLYLVRVDNVQFVELDCEVNNLEVEDEHHYIAGEVLVHNCNKDPALSSGEIVAEAYNPEMRRGELLVKVQNDKWMPELEKLARGEDLPWSMSCKVPYDICSACLNKAPSRAQYCDHLKDEMTHVKEAGHQIFAINDRPCFFDYSGVFRPADRIAYGLQKVASTGQMPEEFIPSTMLAEMWGLKVPNSVLYDSSPRPVQEKLAAMERLAAMEKQIEATGRLFNPSVDAGVANGSLPEDELGQLRSVDWNELMGALAQAKICLPMKDFFRLMLGNKYDSVAGEMDNAQSLLPGMFGRMLNGGDGVEDVTGTTAYDPAASLMPKSVRDVIESVKPAMSLDDGPVGRRLSITIIRGGGPAGIRKLSADKRASKTAQYMAKQYAAYQLAFSRAQEGAGDGLATGLALLKNYAE